MKIATWIHLVIIFSLFSLPLHAKESSEPKVTYIYKQHESFDFEELQVDGDTGAPGDISIVPRASQDFKNRMPYRKHFKDKIKMAIEVIR